MPFLPIPAVTPAVVAKTSLGLLQGALFRAFQVSTKWGIYDSKGKAVGDPSKLTGIAAVAVGTLGVTPTLSTTSVTFYKEMKISDFPVEKGSFATYNKVETPAEPVVVLTLGGWESDRKTFINAIDKACKSTDLYSVATPEVKYINYSIQSYSYDRSHTGGANMLKVEIRLKEIREVSATFTKSGQGQAKDPKATSAAAPKDAGKVTPKAPETSTFSKGLTAVKNFFK